MRGWLLRSFPVNVWPSSLRVVSENVDLSMWACLDCLEPWWISSQSNSSFITRSTNPHTNTPENSLLMLRGLSCNFSWHLKLSLISSKCFFSRWVRVPLSHHWQACVFWKADDDECEISGRWYRIVTDILSKSMISIRSQISTKVWRQREFDGCRMDEWTDD